VGVILCLRIEVIVLVEGEDQCDDSLSADIHPSIHPSIHPVSLIICVYVCVCVSLVFDAVTGSLLMVVCGRAGL